MTTWQALTDWVSARGPDHRYTETGTAGPALGAMASSCPRQNPTMARLVDVVSALASADPEATIYAILPFTPESDATIFLAGVRRTVEPFQRARATSATIQRHTSS